MGLGDAENQPMETLSIGPPPADSAVDVYRQDSVAGSFAAVAMLLGMTVAFGVATASCFEQPLVMALVGVPFMGFGALVCLMLTGVAFQVALSAIRQTNWLVALSGDGLYLNLRAARSADAVTDETTVLHFRSGEIVSVGKVREVRREKHGKNRHTTVTNYIELRVTGCEPDELEVVIETERERKGATYRIIGVEVSGTHHNLPAFTLEPNRIRVKWNAQLFESLGERFEVEPSQEIDLSELMASMSPEGRVRALALRGQRMQAMVLARRELGLKIGPAKELVKTVLKDAA
ncbi:MAG: hypothetical protein ACI8QZ_000385 [Chlamydiales bacterium]|jgi:hypothetical protein